MRFDGGALGALDATTAAYPGFAERIDLVGTKATAALSAGRLEFHHHDGRREAIGEEAAGGGGADPMAFAHDAHRPCSPSSSTRSTLERDPVNSGRDALRVHYLIDALLESSRRREAVQVPRGESAESGAPVPANRRSRVIRS